MMSGSSSGVYFTSTSSASQAFTTVNINNISRITSFTTIANMADGATGHSFSSTDLSNLTVGIVSSTLQPPQASPPPDRQLSLAYTASEGIVSLLAIFGNALVVYVFCTNRSLRRYRNYYIFALAIADFLVGLFGIPFAVLSNIGLPRNLYGCLFTVSILMVLCTISILCLVAVSIDRYWATTNPFAYYRHMTTSTAVGIILSCWIVGAVIGFLPLFGWYNLEGWYKNAKESCYFRDVMDYNYLVFLYFVTIVFPAILMGCFYGYIYHVVLIKIRQKGNLAPQMRRPSEQSRSGSLNSDNRGASQILRIVVSEKRREAKAAHKLGIIVLFFMICWMPLYTINCIQAFCPDCKPPTELLNFTVILSHANSSLNPLLYAYHLKEFRGAMKNALLQLCEKLLCGLMGDRFQKEGDATATGPLSRSHTLPSIHPTAIIGTSSDKLSTKFRRSPRNNKDQSSRPFQISPKQGLVISNSTHLHQNTTNTTEKSHTSVSLASDDNSSSVAYQEESHYPQVQSSQNGDVDLLDPNMLRVIKGTNCLDKPSMTHTVLHGIEIHVVDINGESDSSIDAPQTTEVTLGKDGQVQEDETNELDSITIRASDVQMTTPL